MKSMIKNFMPLVIFLLGLLQVGCVSSKPDAGYISNADYNQRKSVSSAHFDKKLNWVGIGTTAGVTAAGGYLGYQSNLITYYNSDAELQSPRAVNAVVGAATAFGVAMLVNRLQGDGKRISLTSTGKHTAEFWAGKDYITYSVSPGTGSFSYIPRSAEGSYEVRNFSDAELFVQLFPGSAREDAVVAQAIEVTDREELPALLRMYPQTGEANDLKSAYVQRSTSVQEAIEAGNRFPTHEQQAEEKAASLVSQVDELDRFASSFPGSNYLPELEKRVAPEVGTLNELKTFLRIFPNTKQGGDLVVAVKNSHNRGDLPEAIELLNEVANPIDLKRRYVAESSDMAALQSAAAKYPDADFDLPLDGNLSDANQARKVWNQLQGSRTEMGDVNAERLQKDLVNNYLEKRFNQARSSKSKLKTLQKEVQSQNWLAQGRSKYGSMISGEIGGIEADEAERKRQAEIAERERQDRIAREKAAARRRENVRKNSIQGNWALGDHLCTESNSGEYIEGVIDQWNENRSKVKIKIVGGPANAMYRGEEIFKGNYVWVDPDGWYKCLGDESVDYGLGGSTVSGGGGSGSNGNSPDPQLMSKFANGIARQIMWDCHIEEDPRNLRVSIKDTERIGAADEGYEGYKIYMSLSWIENPFFPTKREATGYLMLDIYGCEPFFFVEKGTLPTGWLFGCIEKLDADNAKQLKDVMGIEVTHIYGGDCIED
jgi:hypothetical protein